MARLIPALVLAALASPVAASQLDIPYWKVDPAASAVTFEATLQDAPVKGSFAKVEGDIRFSPEHPEGSTAEVKVTIEGVKSENGDATNALPTEEWFDIAHFPEARFEADSMKKVDEKEYVAPGRLTIRDKTVPVTFTFTLDEYTEKKQAKIHGAMTIKRLAFGVGQGEWADPSVIGDNVKVDVTLVTVPK